MCKASSQGVWTCQRLIEPIKIDQSNSSICDPSSEHHRMAGAIASKQQLYAIYMIRQSPAPSKVICAEADISSFGYFIRSSISEGFQFSSLTLAERTSPGTRASMNGSSKDKDLYTTIFFHCYTTAEGLSCVVVAEEAYPVRVAYSLINKALEEFSKSYSKSIWSCNTSVRLTCPGLKMLLQKYRDPNEADPVLKVQKELDETKIVVHQTIEKVLERGERLDDLVNKSEQLSGLSRAFYKDAKKSNACCSYFA